MSWLKSFFMFTIKRWKLSYRFTIRLQTLIFLVGTSFTQVSCLKNEVKYTNKTLSGEPSDSELLSTQLNSQTTTHSLSTLDPGPSPTSTAVRTLKLFLTKKRYDGNLGNAAGADAKCMADPRKPSTGTYKAFIATNTRNGLAGSQTDWVLTASTEYKMAFDHTTMFTTNASSTITTTSSFPGLNIYYSGYFWTGMNTNFSPKTGYYNCQNFTSTALPPASSYIYATIAYNYIGYYYRGILSPLTSYSFYNSQYSRLEMNFSSGYCDSQLPILCVEQPI